MENRKRFIRPLIICVAGMTTILACGCAGKNRSDESHAWTAGEIPFYLNGEANQAAENAVRDTFQMWDTATHFSFVYMGRNRAGLRRDGKNTVSFLRKWPRGIPAGDVGYCMKWYDVNGNIVESDIILNLSLAKFTTAATNTPDSYYIEGVLSHEIGHLIGLGHIENETSLMKPLSPQGESYFMGRIDELTVEAYRKLYRGAVIQDTESGN